MEKLFQLYLSDDIWLWLSKQKEKTDTAIAEMVRSALRDYIKKHEQQKD